jgi:hypothetical protein
MPDHATLRSAKCSTSFTAAAKFIPPSGEAAPSQSTSWMPPASIDFGRMSAPVPPAGIAFLTALVLAPTSIILGVVLGLKVLIVVGIALCILLALVLVLGHFF